MLGLVRQERKGMRMQENKSNKQRSVVLINSTAVYQYKSEIAPCESVEHIVQWLNRQGVLGWCAVSKSSNRRMSDSTIWYFVRQVNLTGTVTSEEITNEG